MYVLMGRVLQAVAPSPAPGAFGNITPRCELANAGKPLVNNIAGQALGLAATYSTPLIIGALALLVVFGIIASLRNWSVKLVVTVVVGLIVLGFAPVIAQIVSPVGSC